MENTNKKNKKQKDNYSIINSTAEMILTRTLLSASLFLLLISVNTGCKKDDNQTENLTAVDQSNSNSAMRNPHDLDFEPVNLVADVHGYNATRLDANLQNAWGIAFSDEGEIWISSNGKGRATIYGANGNQLSPPVNIPFGGNPNGGKPTGIVYNETSSFVIPSTGETSEFIYATENGTILATASGPAHVVANRSSCDAVYKGLAIAKNGGYYLYATNFKGGKVDVFNSSFHYVHMTFVDPTIPAGYAPFGIQNINGKLYVSYAKQLAPDNDDDESGPGNGYISIFNSDGSFVKRFASRGKLNSPWGMAQVPGSCHDILVGNFGNGRINDFESNGHYIGQLNDDGHPITIAGLWAIAYAPDNFVNGCTRLYFTAGPDDEAHGLFGYLRKE